ncbi:hypothetical protein Q9295_17665 [Xinfangfangia sp. CPCC 101601]|uniref:Phage portal protein n=1 Tax=Pseudogemmobacter lacusdianii TaxID=3069608 RepID=A0ABU0W2Q7_9RHOB|nr:hypothetical protein [Xinfangfangia sp. CPCC 101601]MDQ2068198.1 hypothetical protein [Xinfangfangia sp. CPCC 101601]
MGEVISLESHDKNRIRPQKGGQAERAERLWSARMRKAPFSAADQQRAAANTHELLEELRDVSGLSKKVVAQRASLGGNGTDSTKQLYTYTLPPGSDNDRRDRLAKKPGRYFDIAKAIAEILQRDAAEFLCRIFEGCSYGTGAEFSDDWDEQAWIALAQQFSLMGRSIIADMKLDTFWREVQKTNGIYDVRKDEFRVAGQRLWLNSHGEGLAASSICSDEIPPVPSVRLAMKQLGAGQNGLLQLKGCQPISVTYQHWLDIRLALAPAARFDRIDSLLEFRTVFVGIDGQGERVTFDNPFTDGSDRITAATINGQVHLVEHVELDWEVVPENPYVECEYSYFTWQEVSPGLLRQLFDGMDPDLQAIDRAPDSYWEDRPQSRFLAFSNAAIIQRELLSGALEQALTVEIQRLMPLFNSHRNLMRDKAREAETIAEARWIAKMKGDAND